MGHFSFEFGHGDITLLENDLAREADLVFRPTSAIPSSSSTSAAHHQAQHFHAFQPLYFSLPL